MARAIDIVSSALRLSGIRAAETPLQASEIQDGLESLNDMMSMWEENGIYTGFVSLADAQDEVVVPDHMLGGIKSNLSVYIAPEYGKEVSPDLFRRARLDKSAIRASFRVGPSEYPDTLPIGSGNSLLDGTRDGDIPGNSVGSTFYPPNTKRNF